MTVRISALVGCITTIILLSSFLIILPAADAASCPNVYRNLSFGSRGQDVVELQNFLIAQNLLATGNNSGYFGRLTKAAVVEFQIRQSLPSTGLVGPLTRAKISSVCGNGNVSATLSASPKAGTAPFLASFIVHNLPILAVGSGTSFFVDFGDGTQEELDSHQTDHVLGHSYANIGTYTAKLSRRSNPCVKLIHCSAQTSIDVVYSVTIFVTGSGNEGISFSATPTSGATPLTVTYSAHGIDDAYYLYQIDPGDGSSVPNGSGMFSNTKYGPPTHTYTSAGTYTAKLKQAPEMMTDCYGCAQPEAKVIGTVMITVTGTRAQQPSISSLSPSSGPIGTQVTIYGNGFTEDNDVHFATRELHVASTNGGTMLTFVVPGSIPSPPCTSMWCPPATNPVTAGTYPVSITNAHGVSNTLQFTVVGTPPPVSITSFSPSSGPAGTVVTVTGSGFSPTGNDLVEIMSSSYGFYREISSHSGSTMITFGMSYSPPLQPGVYSISVRNEDTGLSSDKLVFTVTAQ